MFKAYSSINVFTLTHLRVSFKKWNLWEWHVRKGMSGSGMSVQRAASIERNYQNNVFVEQKVFLC